MPESHKATLKTMVAAEVEAVLGQRPDLTVVKVADGAKDNWTFLTRALPDGVELIDFYHAAEKLKDAFDAAHGADSPKAAAQFGVENGKGAVPAVSTTPATAFVRTTDTNLRARFGCACHHHARMRRA